MRREDKLVTRYTNPTKYDLAPYGQICCVESDAGKHYWIQMSKEEAHAQWKRLGDFLEELFLEKMN